MRIKRKIRKYKKKNSNIAKEVYALKKKLRDQTEMKQHEEYDLGTVANNAVILNEVTLIPTGSDDDDRVGNKITIKSYGLRMYLDSSVNVQFNTCRVSVVKCMQENISASEIFDTTAAGANNYALAFRNANYTTKYKVLWDRIYTFNNRPYWDNATGTLKYTNQRKQVDVYLKMNDDVHFKDSTTGGAQSGSIYLVLSCLEGVGNGVSFVSLQKIRYTDI